MQTTLKPTSEKQLSTETPKGSRPPLLFRIARTSGWLTVATAATIALVEAVFFVGHVGEEEFLKVDPMLGFVHLENKPITFRSEGYSQDRINSTGWRDSEHTVAKPPNTLRIALLGDSRTECLQVPLENTFGKIIERQLNARIGDASPDGRGDGLPSPDGRGDGLPSPDGRGDAKGLASGEPAPFPRKPHSKVEVLNFGMSAFSTGQEYVLYLNTVRKYKPDVVCVLYNCLDTEENVQPLGDPNPTPRPYFDLTADRKLVLSWTPLQTWLNGERARYYHSLDWLRRNSRIFGLYSAGEPTLQTDKTFKTLTKLVRKPFEQAWSAIFSKAPAPPQTPAPDLVSLDPLAAEAVPPSPIKPARVTATDPIARSLQVMVHSNDIKTQVTEAILHRFNAAVEKDGAKLIVVDMPAPNNSLFYFKEIRRIEEQSRRDKFAYASLHKVFPSIAPMQPSEYLYPKNHLSLKGNQLAADTICGALLNQGMIK